MLQYVGQFNRPCGRSVLLILAVSQASALDLARDSAPVATVLLPAQPNGPESQAADKLREYVERATGARLAIVSEPQQPRGAVVSVGRTGLALSAGVTDESLEADGYRLCAKHGSLFIIGRDTPDVPNARRRGTGAKGTLRAAFGLLERVGFRWVLPGPEGVRLPEGKTLSVADDLNVTHRPRFLYVHGRFSNLGDWAMANGFRTPVRLYTEGGHTWHTFLPADFWAAHPEYFQFKRGARVEPKGHGYFLCPSNRDVQQYLARGIRLKLDQGYEWVQLGQSDGYRPCECDRCRRLDQPGESKEQVHVPHDRVMRMVAKTHPEGKAHVLIYPPTHKPSDIVARLAPNAVPEVCLTWRCAHAFLPEGVTMTRKLLAEGHDAALKYWASKSSHGTTVYVYYMGLYHREGLAPKFTPTMMQREIRRLVRHNVRGIYFCGGGENFGAEGPTYYTAARLIDDPSLDWQPLLKEYCRVGFGPAAATMQRYYELLFSRIDSAPLIDPPGTDRLQSMYPTKVLDELDRLLAQAKTETAGHERVAGWMRLADYSHRQYTLIPRGYHLFDEYENRPSKENYERVKKVVLEYRALSEEVLGLIKSDRQFVRTYFPNWGRWGGVAGTSSGGRNSLRGPFRWDFETIEATGSLPGSVVNAGFEVPNAETGGPDGWHPHLKKDTALLDLDDSVAHTGSRSLRIRLAPDTKRTHVIVYQNVKRKYKPNTPYTYTCYAKTQDLKGSALLMCYQYPPPFNQYRHVSETKLSGTDDWTKLAITFTSRPDIKDVQIRCTASLYASEPAGVVWFDDAKLEEGTPEARDPADP